MGFPQAVKMMMQSGFTGWYCMVEREGEVAAGDAIDIVAGDRDLTIEQMNEFRRGRRSDEPAG